jgi:hypothetical protein
MKRKEPTRRDQHETPEGIDIISTADTPKIGESWSVPFIDSDGHQAIEHLGLIRPEFKHHTLNQL